MGYGKLSSIILCERQLMFPVKKVVAKSTVAAQVFRGDECEDVHEFVRNYKRPAQFNRWDGDSLALGFPLNFKGHASAWYETLPASDDVFR